MGSLVMAKYRANALLGPQIRKIGLERWIDRRLGDDGGDETVRAYLDPKEKFASQRSEAPTVFEDAFRNAQERENAKKIADKSDCKKNRGSKMSNTSNFTASEDSQRSFARRDPARPGARAERNRPFSRRSAAFQGPRGQYLNTDLRRGGPYRRSWRSSSLCWRP
jgi:hypothetical protein